MADIKISQLGAAIAVGDTDLLPIVSGGNTLKATAAQVKEHSVGNTNISSIGDGSVTGAISALNTDKQPKTLDTPLTIGGVSKTTVEAALGGLVSENQTLTNDEQKTRDSIAPTENGTYYANSYSKGTQFYHNGVLREVTASSVNTSSDIATTSQTVNSVTKQIIAVDNDLSTINNAVHIESIPYDVSSKIISLDVLSSYREISLMLETSGGGLTNIVQAITIPVNKLERGTKLICVYPYNSSIEVGLWYANDGLHLTNTGFTANLVGRVYGIK